MIFHFKLHGEIRLNRISEIIRIYNKLKYINGKIVAKIINFYYCTDLYIIYGLYSKIRISNGSYINISL